MSYGAIAQRSFVVDDKEQQFRSPRLAINRVYTRRGDAGQTSLVGGARIAKDDDRIEAYGTVDELNSLVGVARAKADEVASQFPELVRLSQILLRVQHELFNLGAILATPSDLVHPSQPRVREVDVARLEQEIDQFNAQLPELRSFVLPGGSRLGALLHVCRTVCRRVERQCVRLARAQPLETVTLCYLNRLSDALFVWSRWADSAQQRPETLWDPNVKAV